MPVFSGFIQVESATETFHVTYLGVAAALNDAQVVDDTDVFFGVNIPVLTDTAGDFLLNATNFTFVGDDVPELLMRLDFGTPLMLIDLVDPKETITTTLNQRDSQSSFSSIKTIGNLAEFDFQPRNTDVDVSGPTWAVECILNIAQQDGSAFNQIEFLTPTFANGTTIPNGLYKVLLRVLKVTGDRNNEADFESWLSPVIGVQVPGA